MREISRSFLTIIRIYIYKIGIIALHFSIIIHSLMYVNVSQMRLAYLYFTKYGCRKCTVVFEEIVSSSPFIYEHYHK